MKKFNWFITVACTIWIIPFEEYVFHISFFLLSLPQLKAIWWLELVKFSLTNILVYAIPIPVHRNFSIFSYYIGSTSNLAMVLFELLLVFPMGNFNIGIFKYSNNEILKIFIPNIVRNSSYFNIISSIVLLYRILRCFKNYDFVL